MKKKSKAIAKKKSAPQIKLSQMIAFTMALFTVFSLFFTALGVSMDIEIPENYEDFYKISGFEALTFGETFLDVFNKGNIATLLGVAAVCVLALSVCAIALAAVLFINLLLGKKSEKRYFTIIAFASVAISAIYAVASVISLIAVSLDVTSTELYTVGFIPLIVEMLLLVFYKLSSAPKTKKQK